MKETVFKCKAIAFIKKNLPGCWTYHATDRWVSGIPDIFVLHHGVFAAIELKVQDNPTSKIQDVVLARISAAGGGTWICRDNVTEDGMDQIRAVIAVIKTRAEVCSNCRALVPFKEAING